MYHSERDSSTSPRSEQVTDEENASGNTDTDSSDPSDAPTVQDSPDASRSSSYSTLKGVGKFISAIGWVLVALAVVGGLIGMGEAEGPGVAAALALIVFGVATGGLIVAQGQLISCIVDIERNTDDMVAFLKENH